MTVVPFAAQVHKPTPSSSQFPSRDVRHGEQAYKQIITVAAPSQAPFAISELARSRSLSAARQLGEAEAAAEHSLEFYTTTDAYYQLALVGLARNKARCSLSAFTSAANLRSPNGEDLRMVALDYVLLHDETDAQHWLRVALRHDSKNAEAWCDLRRVIYASKRFHEAGDALDRTLLLSPEHVRAETYQCLVAEVACDPARAESAYRKAIADQQQTGEPYSLAFCSLGVLLLRLGSLPEATQTLQRATEISPDGAENHDEFGSCYTKKQLWSKARAELEPAIKMHPSRPARHFQLGRVDRTLGLTLQAEAEFLNTPTHIEATPELGPEQ